MDGIGMGWKSLQALILRASLCGANNLQFGQIHFEIWANTFEDPSFYFIDPLCHIDPIQ